MKIATSILTAGFKNLEKELASINNTDYIHLDIMDGHFVPNISFGPDISKEISGTTDLPLDIHLMVTNPNVWIEKFSFSNTHYITVHFESKNIDSAIKKIKEKGFNVGLSIKPDTSVSQILDYLSIVDLVLVMGVEPGFGGQEFLMNSLKKIRELQNKRKELNYKYLIEVDGGVNFETIESIKDAGADILVIGSAVFKADKRKEFINKMREF